MRLGHGSALLVSAVLLSVGSMARAELQPRNLDADPATIEAYYDTVLNVTWLADANYAATQYAQSGGLVGDADGLMDWDTASAWAANLDYFGVTGWRLPFVVDTGSTPGCDFGCGGTDCGYNVQTMIDGKVYSEFAHLWYVTLGNTARLGISCDEQPGWGFNNKGPFRNAQSYLYWLGTRSPICCPWEYWYFEAGQGDQRHADSYYGMYAWPLRDGDVAKSIESLTLAKSATAGCLSVSGKVTLFGAAPAGGVVVTLGDTLVSATMPATVLVPAGATSKTFTVKTVPVLTSESGAVSATLDGKTLSQNLTVRPMGMLSLVLSPTAVVGGTSVNGTAKLECKAAPGPVTVDLSSSKPAVASPAATSIVVPQGLQSVPFDVATNPVLAKTTATVSGTANGITKSKVLNVTSAATVSPTSLKFGNVPINTTSGVLSTTLYNKGAVSYAIDSITLTGTNAKYYAQSSDCGATLDAGASCTIGVTFTPTVTGIKSAKLTIATSATATPLSASLSGTGVLPP